MRRTERLQGLRLMKFEEVYGRTSRGGLCQAEAAEILGISERTFPALARSPRSERPGGSV